MSSSTTSLLAVDLRPGRHAPMLRGRAPQATHRGWAAGHRDALRAVVAEHGSVLVRGLGLRDAGRGRRRLPRAGHRGLMAEQEAFAPRQTYADGVYSSSKWPPNQPMCMHHELSYTLEFPGLMLFACLSAPTEGGATARGRLADRARRAARRAGRAVRAGGLAARPATTTTRSARPSPRPSAPRTVARSRATAAPTPSSSPGSPTAGCAPGSAAARWCGTRSPAGAAGSTRSPS